MDMPENRFKRWMQARPARPPLGTWLMSGSPTVAEAVGRAGFDFVVLDMEHVAIDMAQTAAILQALAGTPAEVVVRPPWNDTVMVKRVMDAGARTLMFPFVQNAEEAAAAVAATRYPPEGVRGVAAMHRASAFGTIDGYLDAANDQAAVIAQIETPEALTRLPEIAAVPGVDAVFTGPADLSATMGHRGNPGHAEVRAALAEAVRLADAAGLPCGIVGPNPDTVRGYVEMGFGFVAVGSEMGLMMGAARGAVAALDGVAGHGA